MSAHEAHRSLSDEPDRIQSLRARLDRILSSSMWPQSWRPWLSQRADDLVALATRLSTRAAPGAGLRTPEEIARSILDETVQSSPAPAQPRTAPAEPESESTAPAGTAAASESTREIPAEPESEPRPGAAAHTEGEAQPAATTRPDERPANEAEPDERPKERPSASRGLVPELFLEEMRDAMETQSAQVEQELGALRGQERPSSRFCSSLPASRSHCW